MNAIVSRASYARSIARVLSERCRGTIPFPCYRGKGQGWGLFTPPSPRPRNDLRFDSFIFHKTNAFHPVFPKSLCCNWYKGFISVYPLLSAVAPHWVWRDWFGRGYLVALFSVCSVFSVVKALISLIKRVYLRPSALWQCLHDFTVHLPWPPTVFGGGG